MLIVNGKKVSMDSASRPGSFCSLRQLVFRKGKQKNAECAAEARGQCRYDPHFVSLAACSEGAHGMMNNKTIQREKV